MDEIVLWIVPDSADLHRQRNPLQRSEPCAGKADIDCPTLNVHAVDCDAGRRLVHHCVGFRRAIAAYDIERCMASHPRMKDMNDIEQRWIDRVNFVVVMIPQKNSERVQSIWKIPAVMPIFGTQSLAGVQV